MIIPTYLIIPPAIVAMAMYLWRYYQYNPANRVMDLRFVLGSACFAMVVAQMVVIIQDYDRTIPCLVIFMCVLFLLAGAIWMFLHKPTPQQGRAPEPEGRA
jgi:chromate transport protein ChrA